VKFVLEFAFKEIRANPDTYLPDIFGNLLLEQHQALYGANYLESIKQWFLKTKIPVVLGFDLTEQDLPAVTVNLQSMSPDQAFLGSIGFRSFNPIQPYERAVIIPAFQPKALVFSADKQTAILTLPDAIQQQAFFPALRLRDASKQEFQLSTDQQTGNLLVQQLAGGPPVTQINAQSCEAITPYQDIIQDNGSMLYSQNLLITIHADGKRNDGLWLWQICMWAMLRYRPMMVQLFGIDLAFASASDFMKVDSFVSDHVWARSISLSTKTMWTWKDTTQQDILGFLYSFQPTQSSDK
jgi:hypothetical protein